MNETISKFFDERKEAWLKKNLKSSMLDDEVLELHEECAALFSLEVWLPNASKRAGQISISTHPCTFSHPSSRKNKNGDVTPIIAENKHLNDGFLRTGNVEVQSDALGNAAALDVHKFLNLKMPDGKLLLEHIKSDSELAKSLLKIKSKKYEVLKDEFLEMINSSSELVTSSKIKQVYFPVEGSYHQLSILTNSGMVYELKKRVDTIHSREDEESRKKRKELKKMRWNNKYSEIDYNEVLHITEIAYGGTKPQNISVLNNKNYGKAYLLNSMPPELKQRNIRFPKGDFFSESINPWKFKSIFDALHNIFKVPNYSNEAMRNARKHHYEQLTEKVIEQMWSVRLVEEEQYYEKNSKLKSHQEIWLLNENSRTRDDENEWLDVIIKEIALWILSSYKKILKKSAIDVNGTEELKDIQNIVQQSKEALR